MKFLSCLQPRHQLFMLCPFLAFPAVVKLMALCNQYGTGADTTCWSQDLQRHVPGHGAARRRVAQLTGHQPPAGQWHCSGCAQLGKHRVHICWQSLLLQTAPLSTKCWGTLQEPAGRKRGQRMQTHTIISLSTVLLALCSSISINSCCTPLGMLDELLHPPHTTFSQTSVQLKVFQSLVSPHQFQSLGHKHQNPLPPPWNNAAS